MRIQPYDFMLIDQEVFESVKDTIVGTGIYAKFGVIEGLSNIPLQGYSLVSEDQVREAGAKLKSAYPNAQISFVSNEMAEENKLALIGGLATSNIWVAVNGTVGVHPLMILLRARKGTLRVLDNELSQNQILADIL